MIRFDSARSAGEINHESFTFVIHKFHYKLKAFVMNRNPTKLEIPVGGHFCIYRRLKMPGHPRDVGPLNVRSEFFPPNSLSEWPKTFGEIGHSKMDFLLAFAENRAVGSESSIIVYYWLIN